MADFADSATVFQATGRSVKVGGGVKQLSFSIPEFSFLVNVLTKFSFETQNVRIYFASQENIFENFRTKFVLQSTSSPSFPRWANSRIGRPFQFQ